MARTAQFVRDSGDSANAVRMRAQQKCGGGLRHATNVWAMETSSAQTRRRSRPRTERAKDNFADCPELHDNCVALGAPTCVVREGSPHSGDLHAARSLPPHARFDIHLTHAYREKE